MTSFPTLSNEDRNRIVQETEQYKKQLKEQEEKNTFNCIEELKRQINQVPKSEREKQYKNYLLNPNSNEPFSTLVKWNEIMQKCSLFDINMKLNTNVVYIRNSRTPDTALFIDRNGALPRIDHDYYD